MSKRKILFIHQGFPGQFASLAASLAAEGHQVLALAMNPSGNVPGVTLINHRPDRLKSGEDLPEILSEMDAKLIRAESGYNAMKAMKEQGFEPDIIYAHPGWGDAIYVRNIWPGARYVVYGEWYYNMQGQEVNFDPAMPELTQAQELKLASKNMPFLKAVSDADAVISPTLWQKTRFPKWAQEKIQVIHDGLNLAELARVQPKSLGFPSRNIKLSKGMPIITFSARHLEPVRGFHYFMRALPLIQKANPQAHVIIMGRDVGHETKGYGGLNPEGMSWRQSLEKELGNQVDWNRVHFLGELERKLYLAVLKLSACHVYLTTPFILSWSFLEAAALGLPIVVSDTASVREFGYLSGLNFVPFGNIEAIAQKATQVLAQGSKDFAADNLAKLKELDHNVTLSKIRNVLLQGFKPAPKEDRVENIILLDD